jgi:soluble lytic murein transglycosylase-like protein
LPKKFYIAILLFTLIPYQVSAFCFEEAGATYGISPLLLWSIAKHESNLNPCAIGRNSNGTYDFGLMQINSCWAKTLGKDRWRNLGDPCTNVKTGAWILSQCIRRHGYGWKAVGCYHSNTPGKSERYASRIAKTMLKAALSYAPASNQSIATTHTQTQTKQVAPLADAFGSPM